jgi:hypothetical protein
MTSTLAGLEPARQFGPWASDLDPAERLARIRSMRAIVRLLAGRRGADLAALLNQAETDPAALPAAADALDRLAPLDMRRVLSSYAGLARPLPPARSTRLGMRRFPLSTLRPATTECARAHSPRSRRCL